MDSGVNIAGRASEFSDFLKYGPIGLAGLMLVLVIIALGIGRLDVRKEQLLRLFMYIGAFCFVVASIMAFLPEYITGSHRLFLRIEPLDMDTAHKFPPPTVTINQEVQKNPLQYSIHADVTAIVDVGRAITFVEEYAAANGQQQNYIINVASILTQMQDQLAKQNVFAINDSCSGGPHGIPSNHAGEITALNTSLSSLASNMRGLMASAQKIQAPSSK
jgi:hypothetical protein